MSDLIRWLIDARKLGLDLIEAMGVRETDHPRLGRALAFPYRRGGEAYAAKFRSADKQWASSQGVKRGLYNADDLDRLPDLPVVICEGEIDALSCMQAGFERAVSVPDGWTADGNKTEALVADEERLRNSPYVIVAADADEAGESLPRVVSQILKGHDVRWARWPEGCKDPNDVLVHYGEGALASALNEARRIDPPGGQITGLSDMPPLSERRVLRIGESPFDWAVAFELGAFSVWTGIPGSGKSTFLTWAAERISLVENVRVGILSFETHAHELRDHLCLIRTGRPFADLDKHNRQHVLADLDERFRIVHAVLDDDEPQHLKWLESMVHTLAVRDRCKLIVVDPWNELEHMLMPGESMTNYVNFATKFIRQMCERLDVHIALVAHPKKLSTEGKPKPPTGYDVADSAAFFNKPSLGVTVHQAKVGEEDEHVELRVWKVRNRRLYGIKPGKVKCLFDPERQAYRKCPPQPSTIVKEVSA